MFRNRAALRLGLQLIQHKLGQSAGDPSFNVISTDDPAEEARAELPTTQKQTRDRSAKIKPPRIISTQ